MGQKIRKKGIVAFLMLLVMLVGVLPVMDTSAKTSAKNAKPVLDETEITLYMKGDYATVYQLKPDNLASNAKVTYSSSRKKVAAVSDDGVITPLKCGKSTITVKVRQNKKTYRFNVSCTVEEAAMGFNSKKAKKSSSEKSMTMYKGKWYNPGLQLDGAGKISVFSSSNNKSYNVKAVIYNAKTGKQLTYAKNSNNNKYLTISKKGVITANRKGSYYIVFTSYPSGCSATLYLDVKKEKKETEIKVTDIPEAVPTDVPEDQDEDAQATPIPVPADNTGNNTGNNQSGSGSDTPATKEYQISFALADGCSQLKAELPESRKYKDGDKIGSLPNAYLQNAIFGGWYYDAAKTQPVNEKDKVYASKTLYGDMWMTEGQQIMETPLYATVTVPENKVSTFTFNIKGYTDGCIESFINSASGAKVSYTVDSETVTPVLEKGKTYRVTLTEECNACYVIDGSEKGVTAKELTIMTEKAEVQNLALSDDVVYLRSTQISELKGELFDGLFTTNLGSNGTMGSGENRYEGSFKYNGEDIKVGDIVAIYEGKRPDLRTFSDYDTDADGAVAYVIITENDGGTYSFKTADSQDVLKQPEVLPIPESYKFGASNEQGITVPASVFDYSDSKYATLGLDETTEINEGDFLLFYSGSIGDAMSGQSASVSYAKITGVSVNTDNYVIKYTAASREDVLSSMDMYNTRSVEINLTEEQRKEIEDGIQRQALASGFLDEAADYLVALSLETDGFKELSDDLDMDLESYNIRLVDGTKPLTDGDSADDSSMMLMDEGIKAKITKKDARVNFRAPEMFEDESARRIELVLTLTVSIGKNPDDDKEDHVELELQAVFAEEILFDIGIDGGAVWEWAGFIPYIDDYEVSANLDWGTAVEAGITATLKTVKGKDPKINWKDEGIDDDNPILDIGTQIKNLMEEKESFMGERILDENGEEIDAVSHAGGLVEKYEAFMEDAQKDEAWINLVEKEIFDIEGSIDPFHVLVYGVSAKFVIKANVYITIGATYDSGEATRYIFYMRIFDRYVKTSEETIMEPHVNYDFYVFGTLGLKVGIEFEFGVGLFSLKLDSVGITAELGVYFQLAGYFYAHYTMTVEKGEIKKDSSVSGAICFEVGFYIEIKFKAQLLSNEKLTYSPTLFEKSWPLWTLGEPENVIAFSEPDDEDGDDDDDDDIDPQYKDYDEVIELVCEKKVGIPSSTFDMQVLNLLEGEEDTKNFDDDEESRFKITISNSKFRYNPKTNMLELFIAGNSSDREECDMTITWGGAPLAFTSKPIEKKIKILWTDPLNARYIAFDTKGGSRVNTIAKSSGEAISAPSNPTKTGYIFGGWYEDEAYKTRFTLPSEMPNFPGGPGITVYAKWIPRDDTKYTVNHYVQGQDGRYSLAEAMVSLGTTDSKPALNELIKSFDGCDYYISELNTIRPDGSGVMNLYYVRRTYNITFTYGELMGKVKNTQDVKLKARDGSLQYAPVMSVPGYDFVGFRDESDAPMSLAADRSFKAVQNAQYHAVWKVAENTPYTVENYVLNPEASNTEIRSYELAGTVPCSGKTGSAIVLGSLKLTDERYIIDDTKTKAVNTDISNPVIKAAGDTVIRFYYDRKSYTVTYKNGQATVGDPVTVKWGKKLTAPLSPEKEGYSFAGWYTDSSCTADKLFDFTKDVMPAADLTLYAGWTVGDNTPYTVEYYGQNADDDGYTKLGSDTFYGKTEADVTGEYKSFDHFVKNESYNSSEKSGKIKGDGSTVLKLYYDRATVTVSFDAAGGSLGSDGASKVFRYGQTFSTTAPTKTNYAFAGWYSGSDKYEGPVTEAVSLTAQWQEGQVNYIVKHYVMDTEGKYQESTSADLDKPSRTENDKHALLGSTLTLSELKDASLEAADGIAYKEAKLGTSDTASTTATVSDGLVVRLYYERSKHTVSWNINPAIAEAEISNRDAYTKGEVYYDSDIVYPAITKTGYTVSFTCNEEAFAEEKVPASDVSIDVGCSANEYRVVFDKNAEDAVSNYSQPFGQAFTYDEAQALSKPTKFSRTNYVLAGWAETPDGEMKYTNGETVQNLTAENGKEITLYAVWKGTEYNITYDLKQYDAQTGKDKDIYAEFTDVDPEIKTYCYGEELTLPIPVADGWKFVGWYTSSDYSGETVTAVSKTDTGDRTYYAKWSNVFNITWDRNGKDAESSDVSALESWDTGYFKGDEYSKTVQYDSSNSEIGAIGFVVIPPKDPTRESSAEYDYHFDGWYREKLDDSEDSMQTVNGEANPSYVEFWDIAKEDTTYYAHWTTTHRKYYVKWYLNFRDEKGYAFSNYEHILSEDLTYIRSKLTAEDSFTGIKGEQNVGYGALVTVPSCVMTNNDDPDKTYEFKGWYRFDDSKVASAYPQSGHEVPPSALGYTDFVEGAKPISAGYTIEGREDQKDSIIFVAMWEVKDKSYLIEWNGNSGDVTFADTAYTCKDGYETAGTTIVAPVPSKAPSADKEYVFKGWSADPSGAVVTDLGAIHGDATYYAIWEAIPRYYSVKFEYRNGDGTKEVKVRVGQRIDEVDVTYKNSDEYGGMNAHGYNADYPTALKAAYTDIGGKYAMDAYDVQLGGTFRGFYVCNSDGQPIDKQGNAVSSISEACSWDEYYAEEKNRTITSDIIVKAKWDYDFWLFGKQISTSVSKDTDLLADMTDGTGITGKAYYDADTMTLTLDGVNVDAKTATFSADRMKVSDTSVLSLISFCVPGSTLTIRLTDGSSNSLKLYNNTEPAAYNVITTIYAEASDLVISGDSKSALDLYAGSSISGNKTAGIWLSNGSYVQERCNVSIESGADYSQLKDAFEKGTRVSDNSAYSYGIWANNSTLDCTKGKGSLFIYAAIDHLGYAIGATNGNGNLAARGDLDDVRLYVYGHRSMSGGPDVNLAPCNCDTGSGLTGCPQHGTWMDTVTYPSPQYTCDFYAYCNESGMLTDERVLTYNALVEDYQKSADSVKYAKSFSTEN